MNDDAKINNDKHPFLLSANTSAKARLGSIDVLRGMDLFLLTIIGPAIFLLMDTGDYSWELEVCRHLEHTKWAGFNLWDLIMPLFMFLSGATIPFSMSKYRGKGGSQVYWHLLKRVALLWVLGMIAQGHLLDFNPAKFRYFSNTLQAIAVGYFFSAILFLNTKPRTQIIVAAGLLISYWAAMMFIKVDGFGGGDFTQKGNLCEWLDRVVLGSHRDHAKVVDGVVVFRKSYAYTWILSSLNFIVTVLTGMFAGEVLHKAEKYGDADKQQARKNALKTLLVIGISMSAAGWLWHQQMPVIKKIWTSSMVLVSSGYCTLLLALLYFIVDYKGKSKGFEFLKVFGMNSILAYMLCEIDLFRSIPEALLGGLEQYLSAEWYNLVIGAACLAINWLLLWFLYKKKIFLKV